MNIFTYLTPLIYWILCLLWIFVLWFYLKRLFSISVKGQLISVLLVILSIDAFRSLFESIYFGAWYTSVAGFLPNSVYAFLIRPEMVFVPKFLNLIAVIVIIILLVFRWLPREIEGKKIIENLINEKTNELARTISELEEEVDIRKNTEQALRRSEQSLKAILSAAENVAFVITDLAGPDTKIVDMSPGAEKIFGYEKEEVIGEKVAILHRSMDVQYFSEIQTKLKEDNKSFGNESVMIRKNGEHFPALFTIYPKTNDNGEIVGTIGVSVDITDRKKIEEEMTYQRRLFETMFDTIPEGVVITDTERIIQLANKGMQATFGYIPEELLGKSTEILYADSQKFKKAGKTVFTENADKKKISYNTLYKDNSGREFTGETFGAKLYDDNNQWIGNVGVIRDITEREQAEKRVRQASKMEAIGTLAGGIAHDFNNILSAVLGFTELARDAVEKDSPVQGDLQEVYGAGLRAKDLVNQILTFARHSDEERKPIEVGFIVKEVLKLIRSSVPATIEIKQNIQSDSLIMGNSTQIHRIMMNLCTNAADAMQNNGGTLEITVKDVIIGQAEISEKYYVKPGIYVELIVTDTGDGIEPHIVDKIFEPYFTTKGAGEGTGLGLSMVHGIVETYGGKIFAKSTLGRETVFTVYLPILKERTTPLPNKSEDLPTGEERILFVDDEVSIVKIGSRVLGNLGYSVTTSTSSIDGLEIFRSNPEDYDLVISDVTMPKMTGDMLAKKLMEIRPDIPVILCTGYSKRLSAENASDLDVKAIVSKPIVKADLAKTVRKVLDESESIDTK